MSVTFLPIPPLSRIPSYFLFSFPQKPQNIEIISIIIVDVVCIKILKMKKESLGEIE